MADQATRFYACLRRGRSKTAMERGGPGVRPGRATMRGGLVSGGLFDLRLGRGRGVHLVAQAGPIPASRRVWEAVISSPPCPCGSSLRNIRSRMPSPCRACRASICRDAFRSFRNALRSFFKCFIILRHGRYSCTRSASCCAGGRPRQRPAAAWGAATSGVVRRRSVAGFRDLRIRASVRVQVVSSRCTSMSAVNDSRLAYVPAACGRAVRIRAAGQKRLEPRPDVLQQRPRCRPSPARSGRPRPRAQTSCPLESRPAAAVRRRTPRR